mmetsp:Transcript_1538/g.3939  ORF Transcript_1538/g.3939 Transcript_1538/m.3939 type:complete len:114 (-) Transcript_1538:562-903(-)
MGCIGSKSAKKDGVKKAERWKSDKPVTRSELNRLRDEFWETAPAYGGNSAIWEALKVAVAAAQIADLETAKVILDAAGVIISEPNLSVCYDEKGHEYEIPVYCLSEPINLQED